LPGRWRMARGAERQERAEARRVRGSRTLTGNSLDSSAGTALGSGRPDGRRGAPDGSGPGSRRPMDHSPDHIRARRPPARPIAAWLVAWSALVAAQRPPPDATWMQTGRIVWLRRGGRPLTRLSDSYRRRGLASSKIPLLKLRRNLPWGAAPKSRRTRACSRTMFVYDGVPDRSKRKSTADCRNIQHTVPRKSVRKSSLIMHPHLVVVASSVPESIYKNHFNSLRFGMLKGAGLAREPRLGSGCGVYTTQPWSLPA